jgi:hypothetical protein
VVCVRRGQGRMIGERAYVVFLGDDGFVGRRLLLLIDRPCADGCVGGLPLLAIDPVCVGLAFDLCIEFECAGGGASLWIITRGPRI